MLYIRRKSSVQMQRMNQEKWYALGLPFRSLKSGRNSGVRVEVSVSSYEAVVRRIGVTGFTVQKKA